MKIRVLHVIDHLGYGGAPIVVKNIEELITNNGIVIEQAQAGEIAKAIKELADDQRGYIRMSTAARKQAENFSWESVAEEYLNYYNKIAKMQQES